jgi:anti-sigma28 factor (negative regulator of flagellin synthesis)
VLCTADEEFYSKFVVMNADRAINPLDTTRFGETNRATSSNTTSHKSSRYILNKCTGVVLSQKAQYFFKVTEQFIGDLF